MECLRKLTIYIHFMCTHAFFFFYNMNLDVNNGGSLFFFLFLILFYLFRILSNTLKGIGKLLLPDAFHFPIFNILYNNNNNNNYYYYYIILYYILKIK
jgi:hypothetical protein